jgi:hypothetical protein
MKKVIMILAMGVFGIAGVQAQETTHQETTEISQAAQDRVKIEADSLPEVVRTSISENAETMDLEITEAWEVRDQDGNVQYEVTFWKEDESFTKKYDSEGKEVDDMK